MTAAYFLKMRTTKKACHRSSFQTARVRRMVRRKHRGELAPQTRNTYLPRNYPHYKETSSCQLCGMIKEYRQYYPCTFALYHIDLALSREIRTFVCKLIIVFCNVSVVDFYQPQRITFYFSQLQHCLLSYAISLQYLHRTKVSFLRFREWRRDIAYSCGRETRLCFRMPCVQRENG